MKRLRFVVLLAFNVFLFGCYAVQSPGFYDYPRYQIMGNGTCQPSELSAYLMEKNTAVSYDRALRLAETYISESRMEGINYEVAFAQMCHETGYLTFQGTVRPEQNNFCGLGTVDNSTQGAYFPTMEEGVRAHIQHLKAYASTAPLNNAQVDPRFHLVSRGTAPNVQALTGRWATDPEYGSRLMKIVDNLCPGSRPEQIEYR